MAINWWEVASTAGDGYTGAGGKSGGAGAITGSLLNRKKKKMTPSMTPSTDEASELDSDPYPGTWGGSSEEDE